MTFTRVQIDREDAAALAQHNQGERVQPSVPEAAVNPHGTPGLRTQVSFNADGSVTTEQSGVTTATFSIPNPRTCRVGGIEVSREAAKRMGWKPDDESFSDGVGEPEVGPDAQTQTELTPEEKEVETAVREAEEAIRTVAEARGEVTVAAAMIEAATTGEIDADVQKHISGVSPDTVSSVVEKITMRADQTLAETGATSTILAAVLSPKEAADARLVALQGDDATLKGLGRQAAARLAAWPTKNPDTFKEWFDSELGSEHKSKTVDGKLFVEVEGRWFPWSTLVNSDSIQASRPARDPDLGNLRKPPRGRLMI